MRRLLLRASVAFILDLALKWAVFMSLLSWQLGSLRIRATINQGAIFSLPVQFDMLVMAVIAVLGIVLASVWWQRGSLQEQQASLFILVGGLSNLLDRLRYGGVLDIITVGSLSFNVSDLYIVGGCVGLLYYIFLSHPQLVDDLQ